MPSSERLFTHPNCSNRKIWYENYLRRLIMEVKIEEVFFLRDCSRAKVSNAFKQLRQVEKSLYEKVQE